MIEKLLKLCEDDTFLFSDSYRNEIEELYADLITSTIGVIKSDSVDDKPLRYLQNIKKDVSKKARKQSKIISSLCEEARSSQLKAELERYNFLHFIRFITRIVDEDDEYRYAVKCCKKLFADKRKLAFMEYMYNHSFITIESVSTMFGLEKEEFQNEFAELIFMHEYKGAGTKITLSPRGNDLYSFYLMKHIESASDNGGKCESYEEGRINEVLEYLIHYIQNLPKEMENSKKPKLYSSSANNNLDRLLMLLEQRNTYNSNEIQKDTPDAKMIFKEKGDLKCKKIF